MTNLSNHFFSVAASTHSKMDQAVEQVCQQLRETRSDSPDLVVVFVSEHHAEGWDQLASRLVDRLTPRCLVGCSGEAVIEAKRELEDQPGLVVWCAWMKNASLAPFQLRFENTPDGGAIVGWPRELEDEWPEGAVLLVLADPYSFPADYLLHRVNEDRPGAVVVGGMASGGAAPGENRLFFNERSMSDGAVGVMFDESARVTTLVSQGCRPIGEPMVITRAERNVIEELGGATAYERLESLFNQLPTHEQLMVQRGLQVGRVVTEYQDRFEAGDFLIRNVLGLDQESGAMTIADYVRPGQTIQFHIRDELAAHRDLEVLLRRHRKSGQAQAGLLFTCNGRGSRLFSEPSHDALTISNELGAIPLAGFFAQGEMGPVGGNNFMHGFTASLVLFNEG